ncbi:hypothetical protein AV530_006979 [Patagioenas fasciata monilis]|uniref:Uncharacterized protein n=1 Tax=Patagioenas fasciata monilis TaxID=372326 RepID=A0A1V4KZ75_PATFA|nr:hypothetical protein AV530_006979 [Patagioenas fasciata monilis]
MHLKPVDVKHHCKEKCRLADPAVIFFRAESDLPIPIVFRQIPFVKAKKRHDDAVSFCGQLPVPDDPARGGISWIMCLWNLFCSQQKKPSTAPLTQPRTNSSLLFSADGKDAFSNLLHNLLITASLELRYTARNFSYPSESPDFREIIHTNNPLKLNILSFHSARQFSVFGTKRTLDEISSH